MTVTKITQLWLLVFALALASKNVAQVNSIIQPSVSLIYGSEDTTKSFQEIQNNANAYFANYHALNGPAIPKAEKRYKRWEYFWQNKACYPNQTKHGDLGAHNFYKKNLQHNLINTCAIPTGSPWTQVGPTTMIKSEIGIINSVAVDPNNVSNIFAGSYTSGLFKSTNGGVNWTNITDYLRLPSMGITSIAIDKHNVLSNKMLFSTGNGYTRTMSSYDYGVYYSINGGSTWLPSTFTGGPVDAWGNALDLGIDLVKYDESDPSGLKVFAIGGQHIYVSFDGGVTFDSKVTATPFFNYGGFKELEIDLDDPNYVYATTNSSQYNPPSGGTLTQPAQLWISSDAGMTWVHQTFTLPGGIQIGEKITVDVTPANPNRVYVATKNEAGNTLYFYYSDLKGASWNLISQVSSATSSGVAAVGFSGFGGHFEVSNTDEHTFYIGDLVVAKSTDDGASFTEVTYYNAPFGSTFTHADIRYMDFVVPNSGIPATDQLMLGTDGGILYSTDAAASWQNINGTGLSITQFYGFDDHLTNTSLLVGGTQDNNTMGNATGTWATFSGGDGGCTQRDDVNPNVFYGTANNEIRRFGTSAANLGNPYSNNAWKLGMKILIDPCVNNKLWFGLTDLHFKVGGGPWTLKWTNPNPSGSITAMAIAPSNCNIIYLAYSQPSFWDDPQGAPTYVSKRKLFKSTDGGTTFTDISAQVDLNWPLYWSYMTDIAIDPLDANHVYFSFAGYWAYATNSNNGKLRVMETKDGANTVDDISDNNNLPPFPVVSLEYQKGSTGTVFAGTDVGIYRYDYVNDNWECFNNNMPSAPVTNMEINYCTNPMQMTASTFGRGIYKCNLTAPTANALSISSNINHVCAGTPVILTATGGASIYNWSTGATSNQITVNPTNTTTYQVNTTDVCGNVTNASIQIIVDNGPAPTINISASPTTICPGTQTFLSVSGVPNYTWQPQGLSNSQLAISHPLSGPYTYSVYGNVTGGCVAQQNITINVLAAPSVSIVASSTVVCVDNVTPITLTAVGADTYIWTLPNLQQTTANPIIVQPITASTYTVKGTNSLGCSTPATVQIVMTDCSACTDCYGTLSYAVSIPTLSSVGQICITNDITIYGDVTFLNTEFKISAGKKITVPNASTLTINESHLYACTDMWQGIEVQDGGRLNILRSLIEDAISAVYIFNNTQTAVVTAITSSIFNKNYQSVVIENYNQPTAPYPFSFRGNVFTCRQIPAKLPGTPLGYYFALNSNVKAISANLNVPYASDRIDDALYPNAAVLLPPYANDKPEAGIVITNVGYTNYTPGNAPSFLNCIIGQNGIIQSTNFFDNLNNGIISKNSNLQSLNNVFQNIEKGNGIYAISDDKHFNCVQVNSFGTLNNKFINCGKGIYTQNIFFHNINSTEFRSSKTQASAAGGNHAVWATTYKNHYFKVVNNTIYNYQNGITYSAIVGDLSHMGINATSLYTKDILISNNTIVPELPTATYAPAYVANAINVFGVYDPKFGTYPATGRTISIDSNTVKAYRGINLQGFYEFLANINKNNILLVKDHLPGLQQEYGITIVDCSASSLSNTYNNIVKGYGNAFNNPNNHGILYKHTSGIKVTCNTVWKTYNGLSFNAQNSGVPVYNNTLRQLQIGLLLDNNGTAGAQVAGIGNAIGAPGVPADNVWFGPAAAWSGVYKTFTNNSTAQSSPMYVQNGPTYNPTGFGSSSPILPVTRKYDSGVGTIIPNTVSTTPINCATNIPPTLVVLNNPQAEFEQIVQDQNPVTGNANKVRRVQKNNVFRHLKNDATLLASSSVLQNFYSSELSTNNETYFAIEKELAEQQIASAASALVAVANQDDLDNNHHVYDACLLHFRDTTQTFNAADSVALTHLCAKCPYTEGFVVFRARALYNEIFHVIENFTDECGANNNSRLAGKTKDEITEQLLKVELYPNPTSDKFSIVTETEDAELSIQILDVQGKVIFTDNVYVKNYETTIQANLPNGIYIVSITDVVNSTKSVKKLVIQK